MFRKEREALFNSTESLTFFKLINPKKYYKEIGRFIYNGFKKRKKLLDHSDKQENMSLNNTSNIQEQNSCTDRYTVPE